MNEIDRETNIKRDRQIERQTERDRQTVRHTHERRDVLAQKRKCKDLPDWSKVYIDRFKTASELTLIHNCKTLIKLSGSKEYRVTGNGRVVKAGDNRDPHDVNKQPPSSQAAAPEPDSVEPAPSTPLNLTEGAQQGAAASATPSGAGVNSSQQNNPQTGAATAAAGAAAAASPNSDKSANSGGKGAMNSGASNSSHTKPGAKNNGRKTSTPNPGDSSVTEEGVPRRSGRAGGGKK